jgi:hypothetical protein
VTLPHWDDDVILLADLGTALAQARTVPADWVAVAGATFAWHTVDADLALAELMFDSARDPALAVRSGSASARTLTFGGTGVTVEIEVSPAGIAGQLTPASDGQVTCQTADGTYGESPVDAVGGFVLPPPPTGPVRLQARTRDYTVATTWVCLT